MYRYKKTAQKEVQSSIKNQERLVEYMNYFKRIVFILKDYQIEFSDLHQFLSVHSDLLHVNGDGEHRVGAATQRNDTTKISRGGKQWYENIRRPLDQIVKEDDDIGELLR